MTDRADVVFPVAAVAEKAGHVRELGGPAGLVHRRAPGRRSARDLEVLAALADEMDVHLGLPDVESVRREITILTQAPALSPSPTPAAPARGPAGRAGQRGRRASGPGHCATGNLA